MLLSTTRRTILALVIFALLCAARVQAQQASVRVAAALADHAARTFLTTAVMPLVLRQDVRYFEAEKGSIARRIGSAASRSVITRGRSGARQFNASEIGGSAIAAGLSNLYYTPAERTVAGTLTRWGTQLIWDTVSNEMKEFWPDIRRTLHHQ